MLSQQALQPSVLRRTSGSGKALRPSAYRPSHTRRPHQLQPARDSACGTLEVIEVERLVAATTSNTSLFTPTFKAALANALHRGHQGKELRSILESQDEETLGDQEQVLLAALEVSRNNLARLQSIRANAEKLLQAEARQAERLQYALSKARSDAAYYKGIEEMSEQISEESRETKARYAANVIIHEVERLEAMAY